MGQVCCRSHAGQRLIAGISRAAPAGPRPGWKFDEAKTNLLIAHGAEINARLVDGSPLVRQAALLGNSNRILQLLLEKGANPNVGTATGLTALMGASNRGDVEAMKILLAKGAKGSQLPAMGTDAYATGEALYALHTAGVASGAPVYRKGVNYLLRTQAADGTWHVKTRAIWVQPYFESGFPYGTDQFISTAGTAWASMALAVASEPAATTIALK